MFFLAMFFRKLQVNLQVKPDTCLSFTFSFNVSRYDLQAEISTVRNEYNIIIKQLDESKSDTELTESETKLLMDQMSLIETRVESYKIEIIEKETLIERLRILNNSNEQEVEKLKRDYENCMTECKGYIIEIQKLNNEKADLDVELNHRNSVVMKLEVQIENYKKNTDSQYKEIILTLEGDIEKLKRQVTSQGEECQGYITEIELLNQEIFRLKGLIDTDPNRYHTEYVIGQKEQKVEHEVIVKEPSISTTEVSRYEMNPKRLVTVRSPFERKDDDQSPSHVSSTYHTRIQRSGSPMIKVKVDPSSEETMTTTSDDGTTVYTKKVTKSYRSESPGAVKVRIDSPTTTSTVTEYQQSGSGGSAFQGSAFQGSAFQGSAFQGSAFQGITPYKITVDSDGSSKYGFEPVRGTDDERIFHSHQNLIV
jgi:hypothetical protein